MKKEKKTERVEFRTSASIKEEAKSYPYNYEEIFIMGLGCVRDRDTYRLVKIRELEEEVHDLQSRLTDYEVLKQKLQNKTVELQNKRKELDVSDKVDVIEYNRNKKLSVIVEGLFSKYDGGDVDKFVKLLMRKNVIPHAAHMHNLDPNKIIEKLKQKIQKEEKEWLIFIVD